MGRLSKRKWDEMKRNGVSRGQKNTAKHVFFSFFFFPAGVTGVDSFFFFFFLKSAASLMALTGELVGRTSHLTEPVMMLRSLQIGLQSRWPPFRA